MLKDRIRVNVGDSKLKVVKTVKQNVMVCDEFDKPRMLEKVSPPPPPFLNALEYASVSNCFRLQVLRLTSSSDAIAKTIVFCETKRNADALTRSLVCAGWPTRALHGDPTFLGLFLTIHRRCSCTLSPD